MRFYVLGPLAIATNNRQLAISAKRLRAVLAILLLHPSVIVSMDRLIDGVWPGQCPKSAVDNIRTYVWQLRSLLQGAGDRDRLESDAGGYRLLVEPEELDLLRFATLAAEGRKALRLGDLAGAAVILEQAMGLWRGYPLSELELGPSVRAKIMALDEQRRCLELDWISARLALGDHAQMVSVLRELTAERTLDECLWRYLVVTLYSMGRTPEALSAYAEARRHLVTELGIEPGPELRKVQAAILSGSELPTDLLSAVATRSRALRTVPRQLPAREPGFVGRQATLDGITNLVSQIRYQDTDRRAVVTVSGPPGVGKTATAVATAAAVLSDFPDGQLYVDLRGSTDSPLGPADALASVLDGFGVLPEALPPSVDRRRALYRSLLAERRMLILLDDAGTIEQVAPLIPGLGRSMLIVTSPRRLAGLDADVRINLEPLTWEEAIHMLGRVAGHERVSREPIAARTIVEACGRLPLAIKIAGGRLAARPEQPLWMFANRLSMDDCLIDELVLDSRAMRDRFDATYRCLDAAAQRCFRVLGILGPDSITVAGLADILQLSPHAADRELERLVYEGLISPGIEEQGPPRYRMPSLLHVYAGERLAREGAGPLVA